MSFNLFLIIYIINIRNIISIRSDCISCYTSLFLQPIIPHHSIYSQQINTDYSLNSNNDGYWLNGSRIPDSIQPINDYVLVEHPNNSGMTSGGILLSGRKQRMLGKVLSVGPGLVTNNGTLLPIQLKPNDIIMHSQIDANVFKYNGKECVLIKASEIYCKIEEDVYGMNDGFSPEDIKPMGSRVLIKVLSQPGVTESGLVLSKSDSGLSRGEVLKIGPGDYNSDGNLIPITGLNIGQQILYPDDVVKNSLFSLNRDTFALVDIKSIHAKI